MSSGPPHRMAVAWSLMALLIALSATDSASAQVLSNATSQLQPLVDMGLLTSAQVQTKPSCDCSCLNPIVSNSSSWNATCDQNNVNVTSLQVNSLNGSSLPSSISNLWALTSLSIKDASLTSSIPVELGYLDGLVSLDLSGNNLNGSLPDTLFSLTKLTYFNVQNNRLSGVVLPQIGQLSSLQLLSLGGNNFTGPILSPVSSNLTNLISFNASWHMANPPWNSFVEPFTKDSFPANWSSIEEMDLSGIKVAGPLSNFPWGTLSSLKTLNMSQVAFESNATQDLPLSFQNLSPSVTFIYNKQMITCPSSPVCPDSSSLSYSSLYCQLCSCHCSLGTGAIVGIVIGSAAGVILLLALVFLLLRAKEYNDGVEVQGVRRFTLQQIEQATDNFSQDRFLGKGGFGEVFKGVLQDGEVVAVKRTVALRRQKELKRFDSGFRNEISILSGINHSNLVKMSGYCSKDSQLFLLYEFIPGGSLEDILKREARAGPEGEVLLTWARRLYLLHGSAQGLDYLHTGISTPIIHRDIKTANILVDQNWNAKVADFGISKVRHDAPDLEGTQGVKGTPGYLDPDYLGTGRPTEKSDVYSFGVVILELATGWRAASDGKHITSRVAKVVNASGFEAIVASSLRREMKGDYNPYGEQKERSRGHAGAPSRDASAIFSSSENASSEAAGATTTPTTIIQMGTPGAAVPSALSSDGPSMAVAPFSMDLFVTLVKLGMQCCSRKAENRPLMKSVAKALGELMEGKTELSADVSLSEGEKFEDERGDEVIVMSHNVGQTGSTIAYVMDTGLGTMPIAS